MHFRLLGLIAFSFAAASAQTAVDASQRQPKASDFAIVQLPAVDPSLLPNTVSTSRPAPVTPNITLLYNSTPVAYQSPGDETMTRWIDVKNNGAYTELEFDVTVNGPNGFSIDANQLGIGPLPQPGYLRLQQGETQRIWVNASWQELNNTAWTYGNTYSYTIVFNVYPKKATPNSPIDPSTLYTATLQSNVSYVDVSICGAPIQTATCYTVPRNSSISGTITDKYTGKPIAGAVVRQEQRTVVTLYATTDSTGAYSAALVAYRAALKNTWIDYGINVTAPGYADFHTAVAPQPGDQIHLDIALTPLVTPNLSYSVKAKTPTVLNLNKSAASTDGQSVAITQFHSAVPSGVDTNTYLAQAQLYFLSGGQAAWSFPLYHETPAVDVSDDGSLVAASRCDPSRPDFGIYVLDKLGNTVWFVGYPGSAPSLRNDNSDPLNPVYEARFSHDNHYLAAGDTQGNFWLIDLTTRTTVWQRFLNGQVRWIKFDSDNATIFAGAGDGYLYAFTADGTLKWRTYVGAWALAGSVSKNYIAVGTKVGFFIALLQKQTGAILWEVPVSCVPNSLIISPDESYVLAANGAGTLGTLEYDMQGTLLWHEPVSDPNFITSDSATDVRTDYTLGPASGPPGGTMWVAVTDRNGSALWSATLDSSFQTGPDGYAWMSADKSQIVLAHGGWIYLLEQSGPAAVGAGLTNAADTTPAAARVSPGEFLTLSGSALGPAAGLGRYQLDGAGKLTTTLDGTRVFFDATPAPLLYTSSGQLGLIAPYDLAGKTSAAVTVQNQGNTSVPFPVSVDAANPALFTQNGTGQGAADAVHADGLPVTALAPAKAGETVTLFGVGYGVSSPALADGAIVTAASVPHPVANTVLLIDGQAVPMSSCASAVGGVNGILEIRFQLPALAAGAHQVQLQVGAQTSAVGVTLQTR